MWTELFKKKYGCDVSDYRNVRHKQYTPTQRRTIKESQVNKNE